MAPPAPASLVGRSEEIRALRAALVRAKEGRSAAYLIVAQGGMGKTRLLRWLEREAQAQGFQVLWGNGLKEAVAPFFVFEQIFRRSAGEEASTGAAGHDLRVEARRELPSYLLFEEDRPRRMREVLSSGPVSTPSLVVSRENPANLRDHRGDSGAALAHLWITRMEGEGRASPGDLDGLGERISQHFRAHSGSLVALDGVEYLSSQNSFSPVLRLLQFVRDVAQETEGHLLVSVNPAAFDKREVSLLESDAEVERAPPPGSAPVPGVPAGSEVASDTLLRYLRQLEIVTRRVPCLIVVDDLHWTDGPSGTAFQFLVRNARGRPVLIVGGAREDEISHQADDQGLSLYDRLRSLEGEGLLERMPLSPFGVEEARTLARQVLGAPLQNAPEVEGPLAEVVRRTGGNPYFLQETLLQLREEDFLSGDGDAGYRFSPTKSGRSYASVVPTSLRRLVLQRFTALSQEERRFIDTAAVTGSEFTIDPVAGVLGLSLSETQAFLRRLAVQRRLVEDMGEEGRAWSFSHPLVWEVLMSEMSAVVRRQQAGLLLTWWEEHRPEDVPALARLAHAAGDPTRGLPWVREALEGALISLAPESAATYLLWMRDLRWAGADRREPDRILEELRAARRLARGGGAREARRILEGHLEEGLSKELVWEVRYSLAIALDIFDSAESARTVEEVRAEIDRAGPQASARIRHAVHSVAADHLIRQGKVAEARDLARSVLAAPDSEMDSEVRARALMFSIFVEDSKTVRAEVELELAKVEASSTGDVAQRANIKNCEAIMLGSRGGQLEKAIQVGREASQLYRRAGYIVSAGISDYNAAEALIEIGRLEEAASIGRELLDTGRKFDLPRLRCSGNYLLAQVEGKHKNWADAVRLAEGSLQDAQQTHRQDDIQDCRLLVAILRYQRGELDAAIEEFDLLQRDGAFEAPYRVLESFPTLVEMLQKKGEARKAATAAQRAAEIAVRLGNSEVETKMRAVLASLSAQAAAPPPEPAGKP